MNTKTQEALKMAIEWVEGWKGIAPSKIELLRVLREALAQPAQEPVAWMSEGGIFTRTKEHAKSWSNHGGKVTPVYTHPVPSWQGLTAKEIASIPLNEYTVQTVERMLKEKNT